MASIFNLIVNDNVSPNKKCYCKLQQPISFNPSAFGCKIAFYDTNDTMLYRLEKRFYLAHELHDPTSLKEFWRRYYAGIKNIPTDPMLRMLSWSSQGNMVYFYEYSMDKCTYKDVFINLSSKQIWIAYAGKHRKGSKDEENMQLSDEIITKLGVRKYEGRFDEHEVVNILTEYKIMPQPLKTKKHNLFQKLFGNRWYK